ncbi:MAG: SCP2 sterol-binding domain-containing protein [Firmicutes bacterium]|nr:SCP2 sterol-binding domain-containing protein [Bacillota bacterium]
MRITLLRAAAPNRDYGLSRLIETVSGVLTELGMEIEETDLYGADIPFFREDAPDAESIAGIISSARGSNGIVVAASAPMRMVCAAALRFLEYLRLPECAEAFAGKNCMLLAAAPAGGGEAEALEYLSRTLTAAGAYDGVRAGVREGPENEAGIAGIIEKQAEDFYRLVRQNRKFIVPKPANPFPGDEPPKPERSGPKATLAEICERLNIDGNGARQDENVREIVKFFAEKHRGAVDAREPGAGLTEPFAKRAVTCRQTTRSLPGRFRPQASRGLSAVVAVSISGAESFEGWFEFNNAECVFHDGAPPDGPDMAILADAAAWGDVLAGKCSAQKAFMIGRLKVRGNFVLLPKFDQAFEFPA